MLYPAAAATNTRGHFKPPASIVSMAFICLEFGFDEFVVYVAVIPFGAANESRCGLLVRLAQVSTGPFRPMAAFAIRERARRHRPQTSEIHRDGGSPIAPQNTR
jgi:hypothetical protein